MTSWDAVTAAVGLALSGQHDQGRSDLMACWEDSTSSEPAQRCVLAHYLADLQEDLDEEVTWDQRALAAYAELGTGDLAAVAIPDAAGMAPSLHLNLGDGYLRQGRREAARTPLAAGRAAPPALGDGGYAAMIRKGLDGLSARLAESA